MPTKLKTMVVLMIVLRSPGNSLNTLSMDLIALCPVRSFSFISSLNLQPFFLRLRTGKLGKLGTQGWKDTCCKARSSLRILRKLENFGKLESIPKTDRGDLSKREEHLQPAPLPEYSGPAFLVCTSLEPAERGADTHAIEHHCAPRSLSIGVDRTWMRPSCCIIRVDFMLL